jgi:chitinase
MLMMTSIITVHAQETTPPYRVIGYYASWNIYNDDGYMVTDIPGDKLTHINYAFANVSDEGECLVGDEWADTQFPYPGDDENAPLLGNFNQLNLLKAANPGLQTLISVGGWSWSGKFSDVALTEETRTRFAVSCIAMMKQYGFDGLDIDWEYPTGGGMEENAARPEDKQNFTLLLAALRTELEAQGTADGRHYLLTIAVPAGQASYDNYEVDKIHESLDWINLMAYDFSGDWSPQTGLLASLYPPTDPNAEVLAGDITVQAYLDAGVPPEKLSLGVPFYGRGWKGVPDENNGMSQPYTGTFDDEIHYDTVLDMMKTMTLFRDDQAQSTWLFDGKAGEMVSFDDPQTLTAKAEYIKSQELGGVMIWQLGGDDADATLLSSLSDVLLTK